MEDFTMSLPIPSADEIISRQTGSNKTILGVWDKTTAKMRSDMDAALNAFNALKEGSLVDPDKFGCAFFKVISVERDIIQIHFKVSGVMLTLEEKTDKDGNVSKTKSFRVNMARANKYLNAWNDYINGLKIDQDQFAKDIHSVAKDKAKPKPKKKGQPAPDATWNEEQDRWILN